MAKTIVWTGAPAKPPVQNLPLIRTRAGSANTGVCLSEDILGAEVHYMNRTVPHVEPATECEGCRAKRGKRWEGYIAAWNPNTGKIVLLTITAGAADVFERYAALHGSIRGAKVTLTRPGGRANGRIVAELCPSGIASTTLPEAPLLMPIVAHIWGLDETVAQAHAKHGGTIPPGFLQSLPHELAQVPGFPSTADASASAATEPDYPTDWTPEQLANWKRWEADMATDLAAEPAAAEQKPAPLPGQKDLPFSPPPTRPNPASAARFTNRLNAWARAKAAAVPVTNGHDPAAADPLDELHLGPDAA